MPNSQYTVPTYTCSSSFHFFARYALLCSAHQLLVIAGQSEVLVLSRKYPYDVYNQAIRAFVNVSLTSIQRVPSSPSRPQNQSMQWYSRRQFPLRSVLAISFLRQRLKRLLSHTLLPIILSRPIHPHSDLNQGYIRLDFLHPER